MASKVIGRIKQLSARGSAAGVPVVFVQHERKSGGV